MSETDGMTPEQLIAAARAPVQYADAMAELQRRVGLARALADRLEAATLPQVLTDREAMVWAAAFVRAEAEGMRLRGCVAAGTDAVQALRNAAAVCEPEISGTCSRGT